MSNESETEFNKELKGDLKSSKVNRIPDKESANCSAEGVYMSCELQLGEAIKCHLLTCQGFEATNSVLRMLEPDHAPGFRDLKKNIIFKVSHKYILYVVHIPIHTCFLLLTLSFRYSPLSL